MANPTLYSVGVGDFIAYQDGKLVAMGKFDTETNMEFTASYLDIRAGKRGKLVARYAHSSNATFSIIAANYSPEIYAASMGGGDPKDGGCLPMEESATMNVRNITLKYTPVSRGDIGAKVWIRYNGEFIGALTATGKTVAIPSSDDDTVGNSAAWSKIPNGASVCAVYMYTNAAASTVTMPAEVNPAIWHIWVDIDLVADKSGSGVVGRQVIEIPLAQLSPEQTINATMDGYSQSKVSGVMLADKSANTNACGGQGVYAYITTEIFDKQWYDDIFELVNDPDNMEIVGVGSATVKLLGLKNNGSFAFIGTDVYDGSSTSTTEDGKVHFVFDDGDSGATFNYTTGVVSVSPAVGSAKQATLTITVPGTSIKTYVLEIDIKPAQA